LKRPTVNSLGYLVLPFRSIRPRWAGPATPEKWAFILFASSGCETGNDIQKFDQQHTSKNFKVDVFMLLCSERGNFKA
jgi:hypothetical protein